MTVSTRTPASINLKFTFKMLIMHRIGFHQVLKMFDRNTIVKKISEIRTDFILIQTLNLSLCYKILHLKLDAKKCLIVAKICNSSGNICNGNKILPLYHDERVVTAESDHYQ